MTLDELREIAEAPQKSENASSLVPRLCAIGLVAYFEAFCKEQFASIINICPSTLHTFVSRRTDVSIRVRDLLHMTDTLEYRLGSVLASEYDFGSARLINGLFSDLIKVSPFSAKDSTRYAQLLHDRNLLVHHRGAYTLKYAYQSFPMHEVPSKVYDYELTMDREELVKWSTFLARIAKKLAVSSQRSLSRFVSVQSTALTEAQQKAIDYLTLSI